MFLAAVVVLVAYSWLLFWLGKKAGPAINRLRRIGINPRRYEQLEEFVLDLTSPKRADSLEFTEIAVLPRDMQSLADDLRRQILADRQAALKAGRHLKPGS